MSDAEQKDKQFVRCPSISRSGRRCSYEKDHDTQKLHCCHDPVVDDDGNVISEGGVYWI